MLFVVQSLSRDRLFATPWTVARQTPLCIGLRMLVIGIYSAKIQEKNHITVRILYTRCILYSSVSAKASFILFHFHQEAFEFLFTFFHKGAVICVSEIIDISPSILIPASASSSPVFCMMYSARKLNKQGDNILP